MNGIVIITIIVSIIYSYIYYPILIVFGLYICCSVRIELTETVTTVYSFIFLEGTSGTNSTTFVYVKLIKLTQHFCTLMEYY